MIRPTHAHAGEL